MPGANGFIAPSLPTRPSARRSRTAGSARSSTTQAVKIHRLSPKLDCRLLWSGRGAGRGTALRMMAWLLIKAGERLFVAPGVAERGNWVSNFSSRGQNLLPLFSVG